MSNPSDKKRWPRRIVAMITVGAFGVGLGAGVLTAWLGGRLVPDLVGPEPARVASAGLDALTRLHSRAGPPAATVTPAPEARARQTGAPAGPEVRARSQPRRASLTHQTTSALQARVAKAKLGAPGSAIEQVRVRRGDTLTDILARAQIDRTEAQAAVRSLKAHYDPRRLRAGQELTITAGPPGDADRRTVRRRLLSLAFDLDFDHEIRVTRTAGGAFAAAKLARPQHRELVRRAGRIDDSLYLSAGRAGVPQDVIVGLIRLFSWDVDFQRDVRPGDGFETLYEEVTLEDGSAGSRGGALLYAGLAISGDLLDAYRFDLPDGEVGYFDRRGRSLRKFLLRTPVDGARLSSRFGMRKHPILGYSRMHKGVDFAAPRGTPIYAAGSGRIVAAGRNGGYGNYIRLRHSGKYSTAYAHLSRIAKGIKRGRRVRQGQVIGYVGTTGRSTGPHLHYEVLRNGKQINPLKVKQPPLSQLAGARLERFRQEVVRIDALRADLTRPQLASKAH